MPGLIVVVYAWSVEQAEARLRASAEITAVTKLLVRDQKQWVEQAKSMLETVASGPSVRRSDMRPICNDLLTNLRGSSAKYLNIGFADLQGVVGERFEAEVSSSAYVDAAQTPCASIVIRDVTQRIAQEKQIHDLAFFDPLIALPNRRMLLDRLDIHLAAVGRHAEVGALMVVDLDNFKNVNDARGHATGDVLLKLVAQRLAGLVRTEETVARLGGDEFVIILPRLGHAPCTRCCRKTACRADRAVFG